MLKIKSLAYTLRINQSGSWKVQRRNYHHQNNQNRRTNPLLLCRFYTMCRADMTFAVDGVLHNQLSVRLTHFRSYTMYSAALIIRTFAVDWMLKKTKTKTQLSVGLTRFRSYTICRADSYNLCNWLGVKTSFQLSVRLTYFRSHIMCRDDTTFAVDWALKNNYLSVSHGSGLTLYVALILPLTLTGR